MLEKKLHACARYLTLKLLRAPKIQRAFVKDSGFSDFSVADELGLAKLEDEKPFERTKALELLKQQIHASGKDHNKRIPACVQDNLNKLTKLLELNALDCGLLFCVCLQERFGFLRDALDIVRPKMRRQVMEQYALMLDTSPQRMKLILSENGVLFSSGFLRWSHTRSECSIELARDSVAESLLSEKMRLDDLLKGIVNPAPTPTLTRKNFKHLGAIIDDLELHLKGVLKAGAAGCNILIYGPPGSGKSELSRVLARRLGKSLMEIPFKDEDNDPVSPSRRIEYLRSAQKFLQGRPSLLVFDECEDVFRGEGLFNHGYAQQRKAWMNRMLESNPVPTIWITNAHRCIDEAFLRRYDIVLEIAHPNVKQRKQILRQLCSKSLKPETLERCAQTKPLSIATITKANAVASRLHPVGSAREASFARIVDSFLKAQDETSQRITPKTSVFEDAFDPKYLNADPPLDELVKSLSAKMQLRCLLHGVPGTGKTAFGRWLSKQLEMPLQIKRASDLLSPFLGMTERYLAKVFSEAEEEGAILMIDEVDSFLQDRRHAQRQWEVSQVNEFLTSMETFDGVVLCSTNQIEMLDPGCMRRFDLKIGLQPLLATQSLQLLDEWCRRLKLPPAPSTMAGRLCQLQNCTPGDFANAVRQHRLHPFADGTSLLEAVERECEFKEGNGARRMGF